MALDLSDKFPDVALQAKYSIGLAQAFSGSAAQGANLCADALAMAQTTKSRSLITNAQLALAEALLAKKMRRRPGQSPSTRKEYWRNPDRKNQNGALC